MSNDLSISELDILLEALDAWKDKNLPAFMIGGLLESMFSRNDPRSKQALEEKYKAEGEKYEAKRQDLVRKAEPIKAKLAQLRERRQVREEDYKRSQKPPIGEASAMCPAANQAARERLKKSPNPMWNALGKEKDLLASVAGKNPIALVDSDCIFASVAGHPLQNVECCILVKDQDDGMVRIYSSQDADQETAPTQEQLV